MILKDISTFFIQIIGNINNDTIVMPKSSLIIFSNLFIASFVK